MRAGSLILVVVLVLASASTQAAPAQATTETEQQGRRLFQRAEAHFRAGLFAEALGEYQAGYEMVALPGFLINIAQCQRRLGDLKQARATYKKFVMVAPDSKFVPEVEKLIGELDGLISESEETPSASVAKQPPANTVRTGDSAPALGSQEPRLSPRSMMVKPEASLVSLPATPPTPSTEKGTRWWLWGTVSAAVVAVATVTFFVFRDPGTNTLQSGSLGTLRR